MNFASVLEKRYKHSRFAHFYTNSFALIRESFALIRESFALFRESFAFIRESYAFLRESFALIREKYNFFSTKMSPIGFRTNMVSRCQLKKVMGRTWKHVKKLFKFDLAVKFQGRILIMNVRDTWWYTHLPNLGSQCQTKKGM